MDDIQRHHEGRYQQRDTLSRYKYPEIEMSSRNLPGA
jgi:hypothetical protein